MSNLINLQIPALEVSGRNYLSWVLDAKMHLQAMGLADTISEENQTSLQDKSKAMIFLRHHLNESLKAQYLTVEDPLILWNNLKERYGHQRDIFLPRAKYEWTNLRLQDFPKVSDYNSELFRITSQLKLCGENITDAEMLERTLTTFHASNMILQQQYRERRFQKYSDLISCLLVAEQNNELLMKNHESRPTGSKPFPEANANIYTNNGHGRGRKRGRGGHGYRPRGGNRNSKQQNKKSEYHHKWNVYKRENNEHGVEKKYPKNNNTQSCYRCGGKGHWSRTCRTDDHLVNLYQASKKKKGKEIETNFIDGSDPVDITHLDVSDFFEDPEIDRLIGKEKIHRD